MSADPFDDDYPPSFRPGGHQRRPSHAHDASAAHFPRDADDDGSRPPTYRGSAGGASAPRSDALNRATMDELRALNQQLERDLAEKEAEVARLEEATHRGALQQKLQSALLDNRDLRARLDDLRGARNASVAHASDAAALLGELEALKGELSRSQAEFDSLLAALQRDNEQLRDELHAAQAKVGAHERESHELEEEMTQLRADLQAGQAERQSMAQQLAVLKSGGRVAQLEERLEQCTQLLQSKEAENDTLLREMAALQSENEALRSIQHAHIQDVQVKHVAELKRSALALQEKQNEIASLHAELASQVERNKALERMKSEHDSEVLELKARMSEYERGYGLADSVNELRQMKTQLKKISLERADERDLLNRRDKDLQRYVAENRQLKRMAGVEESWGLNADDLQLHSAIELQKLQALHRTDTRIIKRLEEERIELLDQLRKGATDRTQDGLVYLGLNAEQTRLMGEYAERLRTGDSTLPQSDQSTQLQAQLEQVRSELHTWKDRHARALVEKDEMQAKLVALMERDKGMAYEQILQQITDLKVNYNLAQLTQSTPAVVQAGVPPLHPIPESPRGARSPSARVSPSPLPPNSSVELRSAADKVASLALPDKHALFTRLYHEFQPAAAAAAGAMSPRGHALQVPVMPGSRLTSPRNSARELPAGAAQAQGQQFAFPAAAAAAPAGSGASHPPDSHLPPFDASSHPALLSLDPRTLASMDPGSKARLIGALSELLAKERENNDLLDALELYQIRFEKLSARQQMLYIEYNNSKAAWAEEKESLRTQVEQVVEEKEQTELTLAKLQHAEGGDRQLQRGTPEYDSELERLRRANMVLQTNERVLARRYNSLEEQFHTQSARYESTKREFIDMESTLRLRILELSKRKKLLESRCTSVQSLVSSWVPKEELFKLARKYNALSNQYADVIAKQDLAIITKNECVTLRRQAQEAEAKRDEMECELKLQVEKIRGLEEALEAVEATMIPNPDPTGAKGKKTLAQRMAASTGAAAPPTSTTHSIPALLAELADLRARESSASKRCARLDEHLGSTNAHCSELEEELLTLRKKHHELSIAFQAEQEVVMELRNRMEGCITYTKANQLQQALLEANEKIAESQAMQEHLRQIADLANHQALQLLALRPEDPSSGEEHEQLVKQLRHTISELEAQSDDQARIGKVHRENMNLKLAIRDLERTVAELRQGQSKATQQILLLEKELDIKHTDLYRLHSHARQTLAEKEQSLLALTAASTTGPGGHTASAHKHPMTLQQAETIHQATVKMQQQLEEQTEKATRMQKENEAFQLQVAELTIQLQQAKELAALLPLKTLNSSQRASQRRGAAPAPKPSDDPFEEDGLTRPLPPSLTLQGSAASSVLDSEEYSLKLRQQLVKYSTELSKLKLSEVRSLHALQGLESKVGFQASEIDTYEAQLAKLQQELVEKDLYITQKEADFKEQYMYLKEQESKLKLAESLKRLDARQHNKRQQRNAANTIKRMTGQSNGPASDLQLRGHIDEEVDDDSDDPFAVHDAQGQVVDVETLGADDLARIHDGLESASSSTGGNGARLIEGVLQQLQSKLRHAKQVLADQADRMQELENQNARLQALKESDEAALASAQEVAAMERARLLSTAQSTIQNLHEQLDAKNARMEKYQHMLEASQAKFKQRKLQDEAEIERLNAALLEKNSSQLGQLNTAMTFLDELPRLPKDVVSRVEMEQVLGEKEALVQLLHKEADFFKHQIRDEQEARAEMDAEMKKLYTESAAEIEALRAQVASLEAAKQDDAKMSKLIDKLRGELAAKEAATARLEDAMGALKEQMMASAKDVRRAAQVGGEAKEDAAQLDATGADDAELLRKQVATLERKVKSMADKVSKERQAAQAIKDGAVESAMSLAEKDELVRAADARTAAKSAEVDALRRELASAHASLAKLRETHAKHKARVSKEVEEMKQAHEKEREMAERRAKLQQKDGSAAPATARRAAPPAAPSDSEEKASTAPPARGTSPSPAGASASAAAVAARAFNEWESDKKNAARVAQLQRKCEKQAAELKSLQEHVVSLTAKVGKEQKEKLDVVARLSQVESQLRSHAKQYSNSLTLGLDGEDGLGGSGSDPSQPALSDAEVEKLLTKEVLKQKLFDMQAQNDALTRKIEVEFPAQLLRAREEATQARVKAEQLLRDKREAERALKEALGSAGAKAVRNKSTLIAGGDSDLAQQLAQAESALSASEAKVLELTVANLDLKYSVSHGHILTARLRTRLQETLGLLRLIDGNYLAKEWKELVPAEVRELMESMQHGAGGAEGSSGSGSGSSGAKGVSSPSALPGDKGSSPHRALTLILTAYKKILERLRAENEAARRTAHSNVDFMALLKENKLLKKKVGALSEAKATATAGAAAGEKGGVASDGGASASDAKDGPSVAELRADLERAYQLHSLTRKDLKKEQELTVKLRRKITDLTRELETRQQALTDALKQAAATASHEGADAFRREKNLLASLDDATQARDAALDDNRRLKASLAQMKRQASEMASLIAHVRQEQGFTQAQVLEAAQVQAAVLSKTEEESAREQEQARAVAALRAEVARLSQENAHYAQELSAFDVQFFDELEQLKYAYAQAVQQVQQLTKQLDRANAKAGEEKTAATPAAAATPSPTPAVPAPHQHEA